MRYSTLAVGLAPLALAAPLEKKQSTNIDATVLQFALTLEHLENVFYKQALQNFTAAEFAAAGFGPNYYNNLRYIASDEESHVKYLTAGLTAAGAKPNAACTYKFPYTDVTSFVTLSTVLEGVGTSAYLGGAPLITSKDYLTAAGSILVTEALHTSLQRNAIKAVPFATPYGTPLEPNSVYALAAAFIVSCPSTNEPLPFKPYPGLSYDGTNAFGEQPNLAAVNAKRDANWQPWSGYTTTTTPAQPVYTTKPVSSSKPVESMPVYSSKATTTPAPVYTTTAPHPTWSAYSTYVPAPVHSSSACPQPSPAPSVKPVAPAPPAGTSVTFTGVSAIPSGSFLTFVAGLTVTSVAGQINGQKITAAIPAGIAGQTYVFVTKSAAANNVLNTTTILFGPSILEVAPAPPTIDFSYYKS